MILTPCQCRMARAATGLTRPQLAGHAHVAVATLADFESGKREPYERTLRDIRDAFEKLGITFLEVNENGEGVRYQNV